MVAESMDDMSTGISDLDLNEAVWAAINQLDFVRESQLELSVNVLNGVVTLGGVTLTRIMRRAVTSVTSMVPGIQKVIDNLTTDADLEFAVSHTLAMDADLRKVTVQVNSYRGEVTLYAKVKSADTAAYAVELAGNVPGVRGVIDRINVTVEAA